MSHTLGCSPISSSDSALLKPGRGESPALCCLQPFVPHRLTASCLGWNPPLSLLHLSTLKSVCVDQKVVSTCPSFLHAQPLAGIRPRGCKRKAHITGICCLLVKARSRPWRYPRDWGTILVHDWQAVF